SGSGTGPRLTGRGLPARAHPAATGAGQGRPGWLARSRDVSWFGLHDALGGQQGTTRHLSHAVDRGGLEHVEAGLVLTHEAGPDIAHGRAGTRQPERRLAGALLDLGEIRGDRGIALHQPARHGTHATDAPAAVELGGTLLFDLRDVGGRERRELRPRADAGLG